MGMSIQNHLAMPPNYMQKEGHHTRHPNLNASVTACPNQKRLRYAQQSISVLSQTHLISPGCASRGQV